MKNKIGVAIITCNRQEFFKKCINSLGDAVDSLVVINDGDAYPNDDYPSNVEVIQHSVNKYIGISKNEALRYLMQDDCDHLFIVEDDIFVRDKNVFQRYIDTAKETGIWHLNFAYHGPGNMQNGQPRPREIVEYNNGIEISLNANIIGAFSYYYKGIIKNIGYIDERFKNSWDHVEHTYRIIKAGLHPPFWWFADIGNSINYIGDQDQNLNNSVIRKSTEWQKNMQEGAAWFAHKHGMLPTQTPDTPKDNVMAILETIEKNYSKK